MKNWIKVVGIIIASMSIGRTAKKIYDKQKKEIAQLNKLLSNNEILFKMFEKWLAYHHEEKKVEKYFQDNNYKTIAIYGCGSLGRALYKELKETAIEVQYMIDKKATVDMGIPVIYPQNDMPKVDAIIITPMGYFDEIWEELFDIVNCSYLVSLEEVLNS